MYYVNLQTVLLQTCFYFFYIIRNVISLGFTLKQPKQAV